MTHFWRGQPWQELRSGRWLTADRARAYSLILLAFYAIAIIGWIALSDGLIDRNGKPIGADFSSFYAAGSLVLEGRGSDVYSMAAHYAREQQAFGAATPYYGWLYPPIFLFSRCRWQCCPIRWPWRCGKARPSLYLAVIAAILKSAPSRKRGCQRRRVPRGLRRSRPRSKRLPHRGMFGGYAAIAATTAAVRHPVRPARLQAAICHGDSVRAARRGTMANDPRCRRHRDRTHRRGLSRLRPRCMVVVRRID